jgi:hypothetical protein
MKRLFIMCMIITGLLAGYVACNETIVSVCFNHAVESSNHFHYGARLSQIITPPAHTDCYSPDPHTMSATELAVYFKGKAPQSILSDRSLFMSDEFVQFAKSGAISLAEYEARITGLYAMISKYGIGDKCVKWLCGDYCWGLEKRIRYLYREILRKKNQREERNEFRQRCHYVIPSAVIRFAREYDIREDSLLKICSNAHEHQLHVEFLALLEEAVTISDYYSLKANDNVFLDALGHGIALGIKANRQHEIAIARIWADYGWEVLEVIKGMGEGLLLCLQNTTELILHPVQSLRNFVHNLGAITGCCAHAIGTALRWEEMMERGDALLMISEMDAVADQITTIGSACAQELAHISNREIAKQITAIVADVVLTHKILTLGSTLCARIGPLAGDVITAIDIARSESPVLQTAEGIVMKASENVSKVGGAALEVIKNSRLALETVHAEYMAHLEVELGPLRSLFDNKVKGFAEFANKYIKIEYKHILGIEELIWQYEELLKNIKGFHHDFMNTFKNSGILEFTDQVMYEHGFYRATVLYEGKKIKDAGTFFPAEWSREKVVKKIYEAYNDFTKSGIKINPERDGKYIVNGFIEEGIEIEMHITQKGRVVTAYPILE